MTKTARISEEDSVGAALARYYDLDLSDERPDLDMYLALAAATDGSILELASGSGRISVPLAAAGHHVTGVDRDPHMLERARQAWAATKKEADGARVRPARKHGGSLELIERDITQLRLKQRFDIVLLAFNSLLLLPDRAAQLDVLRTMKRHLAPRGRAVVDVWLPAPEDLVLYDGRVVLDWVRRDGQDSEESNEWVSKTSSARYSPAAATAIIQTTFDAWIQGAAPRRVERTDEIAFVGASELIALIERAGMRVESVAGDYAMGELMPDSDRIVLVCRTGSD